MGRVEIDDNWRPEVDAAMDKLFAERLGPDITKDARRYAPVGPSVPYDPAHPRTPPHEGGELKASIGFHLDGHTLIVSADAPYAAYVELGTAPHPIDSHGPWQLRSGVTGQKFGRHVNHPGTRAQPYLKAALFQERSE